MGWSLEHGRQGAWVRVVSGSLAAGIFAVAVPAAAVAGTASRADAVAGVASGTPGRLSVSGTHILTPGGISRYRGGHCPVGRRCPRHRIRGVGHAPRYL